MVVERKSTGSGEEIKCGPTLPNWALLEDPLTMAFKKMDFSKKFWITNVNIVRGKIEHQ